MGLKETIYHSLAQVIVERPGRKRSLDEWAQRLESTLAEIDARAAASKDPVKGAAQLRHVITVERWGQSRLRVLLGKPLRTDASDAYAPNPSLSMAQLREVMHTTRAVTVALVQALADAGVSLEATVPHNDYGPLTVRGWLAYLNDHATREASRIR